MRKRRNLLTVKARQDELARLREAYERVERLMLQSALDAAGSVCGAARLLGCPRTTMQKAIARHAGLSVPEYTENRRSA